MSGTPRKKPRIVTLIASATEIVCALGFGHLLVGRSHECDFPAWVRELPACSEPKFPTDGTSYQIDQRVRAIVQEGLSVYRVHADRLRKLAPDLIITQTQCQVCAVSERDLAGITCDFLGKPARILSLRPERLEDLWENIRQVGRAIAGQEEAAVALIKQLRERIQTVQRALRQPSHVPTVLCIEWIEPLMATGFWMPQLVELAGGRNVVGQVGCHGPFLSPEQFQQLNPDVLIVMPCGWDLERTRAEMPVLASTPYWAGLKAVREGRVYLADGNQYFNRPGPRLVDSLEILAEILHPDCFPPRHAGTAWVRYNG